MPSFCGCIRARGGGSLNTGVPLRAVGGALCDVWASWVARFDPVVKLYEGL